MFGDEEYDFCIEHRQYLPCRDCQAIADRKLHQIEHEASVKRQKAKLKPFISRSQEHGITY